MAEISLQPVTAELVEKLRRRQGFGPALLQSLRVIKAMILREAITRFGSSRLGYLLAFIEPTLYFVGFIILRTLILDRVPFGESGIMFLISGFITVRIFISVSRNVMFAIVANQTLMTFPSVTPLSAVFARAAVEIFTMSTILVVFYSFITWDDASTRVHDPVGMTWAALALFGLSAGVGCLNAVLVTLMPSYKLIYTLISLPVLIMSGVFYVPALLPIEAQQIIIWNPVLHCVEWFRAAIYMDYIATLDRSYPTYFGLICGGLGIILSQIFRVRLLD